MTMTLGTGSSEVTERLARVVSRWNVIHVSYGAISPALSDRKNFPFFFRTVAPDSSHNAAILAFVQHFRWDTVATLHEQGDNHALPMNKLVTDLEQANISVSFTKGLSEKDYKEHLQELKDQDCRIFIGSFSYQLVRKIFCHIYHLKMFGAEYVWILQGDLKSAWWRNVTDTECTRTQLAKAAMGVLVVGSYYGHESNETTVAGITAKDLLSEIGFHKQIKNSGFVSQAYDAVWALALALEQTEREYIDSKSNISINHFSYSDFEMTQQIATVLGKLKFTGVSGPVSFHNSDRVCITSFHQNQGRKELQLVFLHYPEAEDINFECKECVKITWQGSKVPIARRIIRLRVAVLARGVLICVTSLAVFGVILALTFLSFNLYYRKLKFIKLSSPNLNNFVLVGCVFVYVAMILLGMDHSSLTSDNHFKIVCSARAFLLSGGFSVAFGCMFIKTYRVYHIFIRSNTGIVKSKLLHDQQLLAMVSVLVLVDCILVTLWVTLDPMERHLRNLTMQVNPSERNVVYLYQREQCYSTHMAKWLGSLYIYKGLLLVVGCYMAWETRHVKIPALNDSQYIGMSVYNVVITSTLVVALANVIPVERYTLTFVLVSTLIFVSTTMTICLLFVPKIHTIMTRIDDEGAIVATPGVKVEYKTRRFAIDESRESMYRAEVLNRALKRELMELEAELTRLSEKAGIVPPMRKSLELLQQEDDSDDDLPPWLADYKKYPPRSNLEGVWYSKSKKESDSGACFSMLSAVHPLLLSAVEHPSAVEEKNISESTIHVRGDKTSSTAGTARKSSIMRSSLPTITLADCCQKLSTPVTLDQVRTCASDRALNRIKNVSKPTMSKIANWSLGKLNCNRATDPFKSQKPSQVKSFFSKSSSRLQNGWNQSSSLPKIISSVESSHQSLCSGHTNSLESDWATATLYSSSFATAQEDVSSNSNTNNNHTLITPPQSPHQFSLPRDSLTDSTSSNGPFYTDNSSSSGGGGKNENPFGSSIKRKPIHFQMQDISKSHSTSAHYPQTKSSTTSSDSNNAINQYYPSSSSNGSNLADDQDVFFNCDSNDVTPSNDDELTSLLPQESALIKTAADSSTHSGFLSKCSDTSSKNSFLELEEMDYDKGTPTNSRTLMTQSSSSEETSVMEESELYASTAEGLKHSTSAGNISNITLSANFSNTAKNIYDSATLVSCTASSNNNNNEDTSRSLLIESDNVATSEIAETENNNLASESSSDRENIRQQIFQLERDLILLDLEKSDAIDL